jgi:hypothetical protein
MYETETVLRAAIAALVEGDVETLKTLFADDVVNHMPGTNKISGDFKGAEHEMFGFPRLRQLVAHHRAGETMIASLLLELDGFMSGEHDDDITLLTLTRATTPGGDGRAGSGSLPRLAVGLSG